MPNVIIIGASSGIGQALAEVYAEKGATLGLTARRMERLEAMKQTLPSKVFIKEMDVSQYDAARDGLMDLIEEMGGADIIVLNAGFGMPMIHWAVELNTIEINATGFAALANQAYVYFAQKGSGHIVGMSSIMAVRGQRKLTAYAATKAFMSSYLEGLRFRAVHSKLPIAVSDIRPGYVATEMTEGDKKMFWAATSQKAARQIYQAIKNKRKRVYITKRWLLIAWAMKLTPDWLYYRQ